MKKIKSILKQKNVSQIRDYISDFPLVKIAESLEKLKFKESELIIRSLKSNDQSKLFPLLTHEIKEAIIKNFTKSQIAKIIIPMHTEDVVDFLEEFQDDLFSKAISVFSPKKCKEIIKILNYSDDLVGSIVSTDIVTLKKSWTISEALEVIKNHLEDIHFSHYFYIVDNKNKLVGYVKVKDIIFENGQKPLKNFVKPTISVKATTDKQIASQIFSKYNMSSLPVLDYNNEVIGIITSNSVIDVIQEEVGEDFQVIAGIKASKNPYSKNKVFKLFKSRVIWLLLLMISSTLSQVVLDAFLGLAGNNLNEQTSHIATIGITSAIVAILPVISGAAGNAGSQSSTTIIRALSTGDITTKDYLKVFGKELKTSTLIGFLLGIANFLRLLIYYSVSGDINDSKYVFLSLAASLSLMIVIILAQVVGGILPLIAKALKIDPAVMAAPVLTTLIDTLSIIIFFGISIGIMLLVI